MKPEREPTLSEIPCPLLTLMLTNTLDTLSYTDPDANKINEIPCPILTLMLTNN